MDKIKLEILGLSASHSQTGSFALVLGEESGFRRLPIIIGTFEAQAIAIEIEKIVSNRPMTHDLFKSFALNFDIQLHEIVISNLKEGVFYAKIVCSNSDGSNYVELDARPSDAIAIGIRFDVPIYAQASIMAEAGIEMSSESTDEPSSGYPSKKSSPPKSSSKRSSSGDWESNLKSTPLDQLKTMLDASIKGEDYEKAAKIRDELKRREEDN